MPPKDVLALRTSGSLSSPGTPSEYEIHIPGPALRAAVLANLTHADDADALLFLDISASFPGSPIGLLYIIHDDHSLNAIGATPDATLRLLDPSEHPDLRVTASHLPLIKPEECFNTTTVIGRGAFGAVTLVDEKSTGRQFACKSLAYNYTGKDRKRRWLREMENQNRLSHPALLPLSWISWHKRDACPMLFSPYCAKGNLHSWLKSKDSPTITEKWIVLVGVCEAMRVLHDRNMLHRDLKPDNILINDRKQPVLCDFGQSKDLKRSAQLSNTGEIGTVGYQAPEVIKGEGKDSKPGDVYSFGMLMYFVMTGRNLLTSICATHSVFSFNAAIVSGQRPPLDGVDAKLREAIRRCWEDAPANRTTFAELMRLMESQQLIPADVNGGTVAEYIKSLRTRTFVFQLPDGRQQRLDFEWDASVAEIEKGVCEFLRVLAVELTVNGRDLEGSLKSLFMTEGQIVLVKVLTGATVGEAKAKLAEKYGFPPEKIKAMRRRTPLSDSTRLDGQVSLTVEIDVTLPDDRVLAVEVPPDCAIRDVVARVQADAHLTGDFALLSRGRILEDRSTLANLAFPLNCQEQFTIEFAIMGDVVPLKFLGIDTLATARDRIQELYFPDASDVILTVAGDCPLDLELGFIFRERISVKPVMRQLPTPRWFYLISNDLPPWHWNVEEGATFGDVRAEFSRIRLVPPSSFIFTYKGTLIEDTRLATSFGTGPIRVTGEFEQRMYQFQLPDGSRSWELAFSVAAPIWQVKHWWVVFLSARSTFSKLRTRAIQLRSPGDDPVIDHDDWVMGDLDEKIPLILIVEHARGRIYEDFRPRGALHEIGLRVWPREYQFGDLIQTFRFQPVYFRDVKTGTCIPCSRRIIDGPPSFDSTHSHTLVITIAGDHVPCDYESTWTVGDFLAVFALESLSVNGKVADAHVLLKALPPTADIVGLPIGREFRIRVGTDFVHSLFLPPPDATIAALKGSVAAFLPCVDRSRFQLSLNGEILCDATPLVLAQTYSLDLIDGPPRAYRFRDGQGHVESVDFTGLETIARVRSTLSNRFGLMNVALFIASAARSDDPERLDDSRLLGSYARLKRPAAEIVVFEFRSHPVPYSFHLGDYMYRMHVYPHLLVADLAEGLSAHFGLDPATVELYSGKVKLDPSLALSVCRIKAHGIRIQHQTLRTRSLVLSQGAAPAIFEAPPAPAPAIPEAPPAPARAILEAPRGPVFTVVTPDDEPHETLFDEDMKLESLAVQFHRETTYPAHKIVYLFDEVDMDGDMTLAEGEIPAGSTVYIKATPLKLSRSAPAPRPERVSDGH
jgi:serine/threonine protein kinase